MTSAQNSFLELFQTLSIPKIKLPGPALAQNKSTGESYRLVPWLLVTQNPRLKTSELPAGSLSQWDRLPREHGT